MACVSGYRHRRHHPSAEEVDPRVGQRERHIWRGQRWGPPTRAMWPAVQRLAEYESGLSTRC
eukprot:3169060-Lingulodinium_polyedra.AAC.1